VNVRFRNHARAEPRVIDAFADFHNLARRLVSQRHGRCCLRQTIEDLQIRAADSRRANRHNHM
jgi:hypothetical protein